MDSNEFFYYGMRTDGVMNQAQSAIDFDAADASGNKQLDKNEMNAYFEQKYHFDVGDRNTDHFLDEQELKDQPAAQNALMKQDFEKGKTLTDTNSDGKIARLEDTIANMVDFTFKSIDKDTNQILEKQELEDSGFNSDSTDTILKDYDSDSNGLSLLEYAEQYYNFKRATGSKCTYQQIMNPENNDPALCSSLKDCWEKDGSKYLIKNNDKCTSEYESCGTTNTVEGKKYMACILTRYCGGSKDDYVWGPSRTKLQTDITCPAGKKETELEKNRRKDQFAQDNNMKLIKKEYKCQAKGKKLEITSTDTAKTCHDKANEEFNKSPDCNFFMFSDTSGSQTCYCCADYYPVEDKDYDIYQTCVNEPLDPTAVDGVYDKCYNGAQLIAHNEYRKNHGADPLIINEDISKKAYLKAKSLAAAGTITPSDQSELEWKDGKLCAENIYQFPNTDPDPPPPTAAGSAPAAGGGAAEKELVQCEVTKKTLSWEDSKKLAMKTKLGLMAKEEGVKEYLQRVNRNLPMMNVEQYVAVRDSQPGDGLETWMEVGQSATGANLGDQLLLDAWDPTQGDLHKTFCYQMDNEFEKFNFQVSNYASKQWYSGQPFFSYEKNLVILNKERGSEFAQVVWKSTSEVGFGISGDYAVARYCEAGNIESSPPLTYAENVCEKSTCLECPNDYQGLGYSNCYNEKLLAKINEYRAEHNVPSIEVDPAVAKKAQAWAQKLSDDDAGPQTSPISERGEDCSENIYTNEQLFLLQTTLAIKTWHDNAIYYDFTNGKPADTLPDTKARAYEFVNAVWKGVTKVGIGKQGKFVVGWFCSKKANDVATVEEFKENVAANHCQYTMVPPKGEFPYKFEQDKVINLYEEVHSTFKITRINSKTGEEDPVLCPGDEIYLFASPSTPRYTFTKEKLEDQTFQMTTAGVFNQYFRIGSANVMSESLYTIKITLCGNEEINPTDNIEELKLTKYGNNKYYVISDLKKWFDLNNSPSVGSSSMCDIQTFGLTQTGLSTPPPAAGGTRRRLATPLTQAELDKIAIVSEKINDYIPQDLLLNLENDLSDPLFLGVEAATLGGKKATKTMQITVDTAQETTDQCTFSITPFQAQTVLSYKENVGQNTKQIQNLADQMKKNFEIGTSNNQDCQADLIYVYYDFIPGSNQEVNRFDKKEMKDWVTDLDGPGKRSYLMKVGSSSAALWTTGGKTSNVIRNDITICGKETIKLTEVGPQMIKYEGDGLTYQRSIKYTEYSKWFTLGFDDPLSSDQCVFDTFELLQESASTPGEYEVIAKLADKPPPDYIAASLDTNTKEADILINIGYELTNYKLYLRATTLGSIVAIKELDITVDAYKCQFFVKPDSTFITIPYVEGEEIDVYDTVDKKITMGILDDEVDKCEIDEIIVFKRQPDFPLVPGSVNKLDEFKIPMKEETKGTFDLFFSIGSSKNLYKSKLISAYVTICGKETLTLSGPPGNVQKYVWPAILSPAAQKVRHIDKDEFSKWFTFDKGLQSSDECGVLEYTLQKQVGLTYQPVTGEKVITIDPVTGKLSIYVEEATIVPDNLYLHAVTKGGLQVRQGINIYRCGDREYIEEDLSCSKCPDYKITSVDGKSCIEPICDSRQVVKRDGTCQDCTKWQIPSEDQRTCFEPVCPKRQKLKLDFSCESCQPYEITTEDGHGCYVPTCTDRQKLNNDGSCTDCFEGWATLDKKDCISCPQEKRKWMKILADRTCQDCDPYQVASEDFSSCYQPVCKPRTKIEEDGSCTDCKDYEVQSEDQKSCAFQSCTPRNKVSVLGECIPCDEYLILTEDKKSCIIPTCGELEKMLKDGVCQKCPEKQVPTEDKKNCIDPGLEIFLILTIGSGVVILVLIITVTSLICCKKSDASKLKDAHLQAKTLQEMDKTPGGDIDFYGTGDKTNIFENSQFEFITQDGLKQRLADVRGPEPFNKDGARKPTIRQKYTEKHKKLVDEARKEQKARLQKKSARNVKRENGELIESSVEELDLAPISSRAHRKSSRRTPAQDRNQSVDEKTKAQLEVSAPERFNESQHGQDEEAKIDPQSQDIFKPEDRTDQTTLFKGKDTPKEKMKLPQFGSDGEGVDQRDVEVNVTKAPNNLQ